MRQQAILGAVLALGGLGTTAPSAPAQEPEVVRLERAPDRLIRIMMDRRARLGIKVNLRARETDSIGAYVDAVTPGGPADEAGIRSGDIITGLDGKSVLAGGAAEGGDRERHSLPGLRLMDRLELAGPHWQFLSGSPLGRLELARLNPELGRYFGTEEGVLVISAPKDSALGLRGGDVVLQVDGREPSSPSHLLRILRSYEAGETFKLDIMRDRKRETVSARIGQREP
jgi:S1-C subfamily serine protease